MLDRVDELLEAGTLRSTGGRFPKLQRGMRVGVLASGAGTNLQALLDTVHGRDGVEIVAVGSDKPGAPALERARAAGVAARACSRVGLRRPRSSATVRWPDWLREQGAELVVLAGYMQLLEPEFLARFPSAVINVHPALLPAFPGLHAVEQALAYGVKVFGVTVHFVDEGVDTGPGDPPARGRAARTPTTRRGARRALRPIEHELLPEAVRLIARGAVRSTPPIRAAS